MGYKTTDGLMRHLRQNGIDTSGSAQKRLLINTGYFHGYHYDTISVPGGMPQLVSQELFDKVQKRFEINKHRGKETP